MIEKDPLAAPAVSGSPRPSVTTPGDPMENATRSGYYNYDRPHGAPAGQTPYERLKQKTQDPAPISLRQLDRGGTQ